MSQPEPLAMPDTLSAFDLLMHRGESNPRMRAGLMSVEVLEHVPDWRRFRETFDRASRRVPRMRQKVVVPTLPTTAARWVCDPDFSLDYHVRRVSIATPGTLREVFDLAEVMVQAPMDVSRPLWTVTLVEGVADGRAAVLLHMSHALTDGLGAIEMFLNVYDFEPEPAEQPPPALPIPSDVTPNDLMWEGFRSNPARLARTLAGGARAAFGAARQPLASVESTAAYVRSAGRMMRQAAAPSPVLRRRTLSSRSEAVDVDLTDLRRAAKTADGSVNDAYLAGLCGALRHYHETLGLPVDSVPMAVPINLRTDGDTPGGNHFTGVNLAAPIGEPDAALRIQLIKKQMGARREEPALAIAALMAPVMNMIPIPLMEEIGRNYQPADIQASNVPSIAEDTYLAGVKVLRQYGIGPLPGIAMMAVMVSRAGICTITARYDRGSITDEALFARCLLSGFDEVLALADDSSGTTEAASFALDGAT